MTTTYWLIGAKPYDEAKKYLSTLPRETLEATLMDDHYNNFLRDKADYGEGQKPVDPTIANGLAGGKRLPYIGWFWRTCDFSQGTLPIGDCGDFVGIMENNKWDYPGRNLTPEEFSQVMAIIDRAIAADRQGGELGEIIKNRNSELEKLWPLFQTFKIDGEASQ